MNTDTDARPIPLVLTALIAFFSALAALAVSNGMRPRARQRRAPPRAARSAALTQKQVALRGDMRKLWEDHITWTRLAIISLTTGSPDTQATVGRLLQNQTDIGNAVKPFYGNAAGDELTRQLRAAHPDRGRRHRGREGGRRGEARRRAGALGEERRRHRRRSCTASIRATGSSR